MAARTCATSSVRRSAHQQVRRSSAAVVQTTRNAWPTPVGEPEPSELLRQIWDATPEIQTRSTLRLRVLAAMGSVLIVASLGAPILALAETSAPTVTAQVTGTTPTGFSSPVTHTVTDVATTTQDFVVVAAAGARLAIGDPYGAASSPTSSSP